MNKKEVLELKRRLKKDQATFTRLVGCYVDCNHEKVCKFGGKFLTLEEDEYYKYLEISNKVLSGTLGNNLLNLQFPLEEEEVGGRQQILMALRDSELNDETLLDTYYDLVIDTYDEAGNYLILLYLDSYDVMTRTKDNINVDESEEVYKYMLCAICPVTLSKPGLGYLEKEQRIGARIRDWVVGCYVDCNHEKVCKFGGKFLTLEEDEYYKYLEISNKVLSGTLGNNLLNLQFPLEEEEVGGRQQILMALRDSELNDETLLDTYYDLVIDTYDEAGNYLILLYLDSYDVMTRTKDNINVDESEEVYKYMLCAICPVTLSKPGLGYLEKEQRIGARIRDWVVGAPETGFLFPAFNDRSTDIHSTLFYTKNTKEPHSEFMTNGLGCGVERTATEQKMAFHSIVRNVLGAEDESTDDKLLDIQQNLSEMADDYAETHDDDDDPFILDSEAMNKVLSDCHVSEEKISRIEKSVNEAFGDKPPIAANVIDSKALAANEIRVEKLALESQVGDLTLELNEKNAQLEEKDSVIQEKNNQIEERTSQLLEKQEEIDNYTAQIKTYDVVLHVKPEKASQIHAQVINGEKCLVIPMRENENATINGVNTSL